MSWSWSQNNRPVGGVLFGAPPVAPRVVTGPSAARLAEIERINRLYGYGAPRIQDLPLLPQEMLADVPPMATLPVPPEVDPSNEPRTPPANPAERADARPRNPGEQNFWQRFLAANALTSGVREANLLAGENPWTPTTMPLPDRRRDSEPAPYMPPENYPQQTPSDLPLPADAPPGEATTTAPGNAALAAAQRTRYPTLNVNDPNYQRTIDAYMESKPVQRERPQEEQMMRLIASALAGAGPGEYGPLGAVTGLAGGYARESDRNEALYQQDQRQRIDFQRGLAGLLGQTDQQQFQNQMARQTFDRQSQVLGDERDYRNASLALQREGQATRNMLTALRLRTMLQQSGMGQSEAEILTRGIPDVVRQSAPLMLQTDDGRAAEMTVIVPAEYIRAGRGQQSQNTRMTLAQARRAVTETLGRDPAYMGQTAVLDRAVNGVLTQMLGNNITLLPDNQRRQVLQQVLRWVNTRPRNATLDDDE